MQMPINQNRRRHKPRRRRQQQRRPNNEDDDRDETGDATTNQTAAASTAGETLHPRSLQERVHSGFLDAMRTFNEETANLLDQNRLLAAMEHLHQIKLPVPGQRPNVTTTALCQVAQASFPKHATPNLTVPQFKKRSVETLLRHMAALDRLRSAPRVVLLGDSMFERLSRQQIMKTSNANLFNFSVGGDGVEHLMCRLHIAHGTYLIERHSKQEQQHQQNAKPKNATATPQTYAILIGINNAMGAARGNESQSTIASAEEIVQGIWNLVTFLLQRHAAEQAETEQSQQQQQVMPPPQIHICQLLHVWGSETIHAPVVNEKVDQVNKLLATSVAAVSCPPCVHLVPTDMPRHPTNYEEDGLHLSRAGYDHLLAQLPECVRQHQRNHSIVPS